MAAVNSVPTRLPLPTFNPRTVLMYSAAVGGEGSVALQLREALPGDLDNDRLTITCNQPELLADLLHGGSDIESTCSPETSLSGFNAMAAAGLERRTTTIKKVRSKPTSPNRQGPQQCQVCNKIFGNASALAKHKLTHSDERKYGCTVCSKAFKRQDHLNGHMLTHRNKKPYECKADGCGKSYCDARSLRRHTENHHHHKLPNDGYKAGRSSKGPKEGSSRKESPISPSQHSDQSSSGSEKSAITSGSESSPPGTPPAPRTPPARPPKVKVTTKAKTQQTAQQTFRSIYIGGPGNQYSSPSSIIRPSEVKPVECNLCHRKFKNIPALNGHMRLHGGYFKKESEAKKLDKKENTGPPLQTASVSVRALIEEKIISRRSASVNSSLTNKSGAKNEVSTSQSAFAAPAVPPTMCYSRNIGSPASPATSTSNVTTTFVSPRAPSIVTVTGNVNQKESTLIELLKRGNTKVVKRCASDPGQASPQPDYTFRPELFGVSFNSDDGYFSPALQDDAFHFTSASELDELALEDYATVAASIRDRSPVSFPLNRRLAAVLNSPLPESLADFGACHGGSPVPFGGSSPSLGFTDGSCMSPSAVFGGQTTPSPAMAYPTPPASLDAQSPAQVPRASSPLSAAFFTANLSSQEEVEEALEEVLPEECGSLDAFVIEPSPSRRIMLNSEDPLLSSSPRDFGNQRPMRQRAPSNGGHPMHYWQNPHSRLTNSLQVCIDGRDTLPAAFLSPSSIPPSPLRRKRRASPSGPCCSRMRRERTHYTPQPMLPPDRDGTGLFVEISSDLPDQTEPMQEESIPPQINIGSEHQADIPELNTDRSDLHRSTEQLLWDPGINDRLDDNEVRMFMELATCAAMPVGGHTREFALQTLGEVDGDVRAATLRLMLRPSEGEAQERWTAQEVDAFHAGIRHHEKDFYRVAQLIRTKTSKQCVHFYYFWKKVTKDYKSIFLGNWDTDNDANTQISAADSTQPSQPGPSSSTPSCEGDEYPCKICGKVFNKVKSRSAHMKSHRPLDVETKKQKHEKPCEKVVKSTH